MRVRKPDGAGAGHQTAGTQSARSSQSDWALGGAGSGGARQGRVPSPGVTHRAAAAAAALRAGPAIQL